MQRPPRSPTAPLGGPPPFGSPMRRARRVPCTCSGCGGLVDAADDSCLKCRTARPESGWVEMAMPGLDMPRVDIEDFPPVPAPVAPAARVDLAAVAVGRAAGMERSEAADASLLRDEVPEAAFALLSGVPDVVEPVPPARKSVRIRVAPRAAGRDDVPVETEEDVDADPSVPDRTDPNGIYALRYSIEERLGAPAGLSRYLAVQEPGVRRVVLTVLRAERPEEAQLALETRFLKEARLLARLKHVAVAPVYDAGRAGDGTCFVTEEVPWGPTMRHLSDTGAMTAPELVTVLRALAGGLAAMHEAGVVHRCLRGDAVIVPRGMDRGAAAQIGRFGLHVLPEDAVGDGDAESAVVWPPEVLAGEEPDEAADLYAVGVLAYHALAAKPPYTGTADQIRAARLAGPPGPIPPASGLRADLARVAERCLSASPDDRYADARALIVALDALAAPPAPLPVARPPAPVAPARAPFRTTAAAVAVGAAIPTIALLAFGLHVLTAPPAPIVPTAPATTVAAAPAPSAPVSPAASPVTASPAATVAPPVVAPVSAPVAAAPAYARPVVARPVAAPPSRPVARPAPVAAVAPPPAAPAAVEAPAPVAPPEPVVAQAPPVVVAVVQAPPAAPAVPGASDLTGLWLGKVTGGTIALDLQISSDGKVSGRARRSDKPGEGKVSGRVKATDAGLEVDFSVVDGGVSESYSGVVVDGALSGRVSADGKSAGKFSARR